MRRELGRIDEDRDDHPVGMFAGEMHQRQMPVMQSAHGRNERDAITFSSPQLHLTAKRAQRVRRGGLCAALTTQCGAWSGCGNFAGSGYFSGHVKPVGDLGL